MKLKSFLSALLMGVLLISYGQSITIFDSEGQGISGAQVIAYKLQPPLLLLSDETGKVPTGNLSQGTHIIVKCLGYVSDTLVYNENNQKITLQSASYNLEGVVITAQYRPVEISKSVHAVRVIDAKEIEQRAAINLKDVLQNELNFRVSQDNILGAGLSMQGISGQNVKIMVDGVPVIGRLDGNIDLTQLNLNMVERIEIIEGPLSVNYGSNALAGTINLITKSPKSEQVNGRGEFYTESNGTYNTNLHATLAWKKQSILLSGGRNYFDGWNPGDRALYSKRTGIADSSRYTQWKPREQYFADVKYRIALKGGYMELAGSWFDEEIINRGYPRGAYQETALDDYYETLRQSASAKFQKSLSAKWSTHHIVAYNYFERNKSTYITDLTGVRSELTTNPSLLDTSIFSAWLARGSFIGKIAATIDLQLGYEVEIEHAEGKRILDETGVIENYALFATSEWRPVERISIKPGIRYAWNSRYEAPLIPSVNVLYQLPRKVQARVSYAQGFRAPGLKELSFYFVDINHNIVGNPDLRAEKSNNISASITAQRSENRTFDLTFSGFYNQVFNLITLAQTTGTEFSYVNIGEQRTLGGRIEAGKTIYKINVHAGFACTGISNEIDQNEIPAFNYFPEATFRADYLFAKAGVQANIFYKFNGSRNFFTQTDEGEVREQTLSAYQNMDMTLSKKFFGSRLGLEIGAKNLFNVQDINANIGGGAHSGGGSISIGTGRTYFARLSMEFIKSRR